MFNDFMQQCPELVIASRKSGVAISGRASPLGMTDLKVLAA